jgi:hypothetical protein
MEGILTLCLALLTLSATTQGAAAGVPDGRVREDPVLVQRPGGRAGRPDRRLRSQAVRQENVHKQIERWREEISYSLRIGALG